MALGEPALTPSSGRTTGRALTCAGLAGALALAGPPLPVAAALQAAPPETRAEPGSAAYAVTVRPHGPVARDVTVVLRAVSGSGPARPPHWGDHPSYCVPAEPGGPLRCTLGDVEHAVTMRVTLRTSTRASGLTVVTTVEDRSGSTLTVRVRPLRPAGTAGESTGRSRRQDRSAGRTGDEPVPEDAKGRAGRAERESGKTRSERAVKGDGSASGGVGGHAGRPERKNEKPQQRKPRGERTAGGEGSASDGVEGRAGKKPRQQKAPGERTSNSVGDRAGRPEQESGKSHRQQAPSGRVAEDGSGEGHAERPQEPRPAPVIPRTAPAPGGSRRAPGGPPRPGSGMTAQPNTTPGGATVSPGAGRGNAPGTAEGFQGTPDRTAVPGVPAPAPSGSGGTGGPGGRTDREPGRSPVAPDGQLGAAGSSPAPATGGVPGRSPAAGKPKQQPRKPAAEPGESGKGHAPGTGTDGQYPVPRQPAQQYPLPHQPAPQRPVPQPPAPEVNAEQVPVLPVQPGQGAAPAPPGRAPGEMPLPLITPTPPVAPSPSSSAPPPVVDQPPNIGDGRVALATPAGEDKGTPWPVVLGIVLAAEAALLWIAAYLGLWRRRIIAGKTSR